MNSWGKDGIVIYSEDKTVYVYVKDIRINVPLETTNTETNTGENKSFSGIIKFETTNDIVIKEKIAYIN
jgi:hypothetical protein